MATLSLAATGRSDIIRIGPSTHVGIDLAGPSAAIDHAGTLYFCGAKAEALTFKALDIPTVTFAVATEVSKLVEIPDFCFPFLQLYYVRSAGGAGETLTYRISIKP